MLDELLEIVSALGEAEASGNRVALCRALVPAGEWYADVDALTLRQTEAAQASLAAEAVRLGVSLD